MNKKRMDLKVDFAFKQLFGQPRSAGILIAFLNGLLRREAANKIAFVEFVNTDFAPAHASDKNIRLDVHVRTDLGEWINIEIQIADQQDMISRTLFYWARIFESQGKTGMAYQDLGQTITINIVNFRQFDSTDRYHTSYHVYEDQDRFRLSDILEVHFIELPKFRAARNENIGTWARDPLGRWLLLLDASGDERIRHELEAVALTDALMKEALEIWDAASRDPDNWAYYISRQKYIMDEISLRKDLEELENFKLAKDQLLKELDETARELDETARELDETARELDETARELDEADKKLGEADKKLGEADKKLGEADKKLGETAKELDETAKERDELLALVRDAAKRMLQKGLDPADVSSILNIPLEIVSQYNRSSPEG